MHAGLGSKRMTDRELGRAIGLGNAIRYAATTGTIAIRWEGARAPAVWTVEAAGIEPADARRELARRYLHVFGPTTAEASRAGPGSRGEAAAEAFASLEGSLLPVRSPLGDEWLLAEDEAGRARRGARPPRPCACCRAATPTSCSTAKSGSCSCLGPTCGSGSGRPACGRARSSSKARSAERGGGRSTGADRRLVTSLAQAARRGRGGGRLPSAAWPRPAHRSGLGRIRYRIRCPDGCRSRT